jgi:hypothetical protein
MFILRHTHWSHVHFLSGYLICISNHIYKNTNIKPFYSIHKINFGLFYIQDNYIRFKIMTLRIFQTVLDANGKCIIR